MANENDLFSHLEQILEMNPGTLQINQNVRELKTWDSLKLLEVIAFADSELHVELDAESLSKCGTVGDIVSLLSASVRSQQSGNR